jgi:putative transposase
VHKTANMLAALPDSLQGKAKAGLREIWLAATKAGAEKALAGFLRDFAAKCPKAVNLLEKDREALLAFYDFPAEHWIHIRTTNPIESSFATIRHRTTRTKNCVSRNTLLGLVFQLALTAEKGWRRIRGFKQLPDVVNGIRFQDGIAVIQEPESIEERQQKAA